MKNRGRPSRNGVLGSVLATLAVLGLTGCQNKPREQEVQALNLELQELRKEHKELKSDVEWLKVDKLKGKAAAMVSPGEQGYSIARSDQGMLYPVSLVKLEEIPGGVQYTLGVTNLYSVILRDVVLEVEAGEEVKSVTIYNIRPGRQETVTASFLIGKDNPPRYLLVFASSKGFARFN